MIEPIKGFAKILLDFTGYIVQCGDSATDAQVMVVARAMDPQATKRHHVDGLEFYSITFSDGSSIVFAYDWVGA